MDNLSFLQKNGISLSGSATMQNKWLNSYFSVNSNESIFISTNDKKYEISQENCEFAFANEIWKHLNLSQRLRIIRWQQINYLLQNGYKKHISDFEFVTNKTFDINSSIIALAQKHGGVIIGLDFVRKSKGMDALIMITHECIHYLDYEREEELLKKYSNYYPGYPNANLPITLDYIMSLPIEGKIHNLKNCEMKFISPQMREDILKMKNFIILLTLKRDAPIQKKYATDKERYMAYLSSMFYYTSPVEQRAYRDSIAYVNKFISQIRHAYTIGNVDDQIMNKYLKILERISGQVREIQKYYQMSHYNAINMELICAYNKERYGDDKLRYICPEIMEQREKIVKNLWEEKFGYYGKYEQWEREV